MSDGQNIITGAIAETETTARQSEDDGIERRLAVAPRRAWWMLGIGATHGYELLAAGELDSYIDGRSRRITVESIERFVTRRLAESSARGTLRSLIEPAVRAATQKRSHRQALDEVDEVTGVASPGARMHGVRTAAARRQVRPVSALVGRKEKA